MTQSLLRKVIVDNLVMDFYILDSFRMIGAEFPPIYYVDHVELTVFVKEIVNLEVSSEDQWKTI